MDVLPPVAVAVYAKRIAALTPEEREAWLDVSEYEAKWGKPGWTMRRYDPMEKLDWEALERHATERIDSMEMLCMCMKFETVLTEEQIAQFEEED
jgi:hypothetical protein